MRSLFGKLFGEDIQEGQGEECFHEYFRYDSTATIFKHCKNHLHHDFFRGKKKQEKEGEQKYDYAMH